MQKASGMNIIQIIGIENQRGTSLAGTHAGSTKETVDY
jgi:hypothetical protein